MNAITLSKGDYHDEGAYAEVFKVGKIAIKCPFRTEADVAEEFEIQQGLFQEGIKVPEPYEIVEARLPKRTVQAIAMELIPGANARDLISRKLPFQELISREVISSLDELALINPSLIKSLYRTEISKAFSKGFISPASETGLYNAVYSLKNELYLVDFTDWIRV
ncbi:Uncharacterised protein [uncultured archaeon]|nr:Uncharacterised protein [uncultured archaeon]